MKTTKKTISNPIKKKVLAYKLRILFDKLKIMINNNSSQIDILSKHQEKKDQNLSVVEEKVVSLNENLIETVRKTNKLEEYTKGNLHEVNTKFSELKSIFINLKPEIMKQTDLVVKLESIVIKNNEKVEMIGTNQKNLIQNFENKLDALRKEFKVFSF